MTTRVSVAKAKAELSALMAAVAYQGQHVIIERRGRPMAALVSVDDLEQLDRERAAAVRPRGALALIGAWSDLPDDAIEAMVADIYAAREQDTGRPVELGD
ncbi:MAG: type II toxin-antitoxin system Phd/YefM family antitoxin [Chloroflexota bacterium]|nr:type II toxin-antitoxin system Phd/YefM family antitoxin [Chloroflexota bacterium]